VPTLRLPKPLTRGEIDRLGAALKDRPDVAAAMAFLHETGLRVGEFGAIRRAEALTWGPASILGRLSTRERPILRVVGKGDRERVVPLSRQAVKAARILLNVPSKNGRADYLMPWSERGLRWLFSEAGERAGVWCHPHRWRHTWVTELVEAGNPIELVADMAGHSSTETTRLYYLLSEGRKHDALRRRARWLRRR
jgi:integrase